MDVVKLPKNVINYYHLISSDITRIPLTCESTRENGAQKRYASHNFYEGTINYNKREALFFLQKQVSNNEELSELMEIIAEMSLANVRNALSKDKARMGNERFESRTSAEELFRKYGVPQNLMGKWELSIAHAFYQRFTEDATIIVPGYVLGVSVNENSRLVSQIETISSKEQSEIERKIREQNFKGPLNFW